MNANNKELIKQLNDVIGKEVKLDYKQEYVKMSWTGDTRYFIKYVATKIEELQ